MTQAKLAVVSAALFLLLVLLVSAGATVPASSGATGAPLAPTAAPASTVASAASASSSTSTAVTFGTNQPLASTVSADERSMAAAGVDSTSIHPPNLHQAPSLSSTGGKVTPLYDIAPAPMGVGYYGLNDTNGTVESTTVNTTSLAGTYSTSDPLGTQTEEFDVSTGSSPYDIQPSTDSYGAQLNAVITNVTLFGKTSLYNPQDPDAPTGCPGYDGNPSTGPAPCPNEFWLQNYIEYVPATGIMMIGDEIWNFSNPTASWGVYNGSTVDQNSLVGFGSINYGLYYLSNTASEYGPTIHIDYPFTLVLYLNVTRGPCHSDVIPGTGVPSCTAHGSKVSTTEPVNEIFFNYSVWKTSSQACPSGDVCQGNHVCPAVEPYAGIVCGEYDDIFFNSVNPATPHVGVPAYGPDGRIGSAVIQANGSAYDPVGLTNDFEFDYGIGSDDGDTNGVAYQDGTVGVNYCDPADTLPNGACTSYSAPPAAFDFGGETGETSTGEVDYWAPQATPSGAGLLTGPGAPVAHETTGPSLLIGLWNMSGYPYPEGAGAHALSYAHISPANAWVGIAQGAGATSQAGFQVAPTFGWFSYWKGSGGATSPTELGSDLYLPPGEYTIEVLLSGYAPYIATVDLTSSSQAPQISLVRDAQTGVYTPLWAFSSSDLANISSNAAGTGVGSSSHPYQLDSRAPTVGAPFGKKGSLSWLFSNLNDYLFPVWYGEYLNSTTAYAQSDPAPSFEMTYPSWQVSELEFFGAPTTYDFQLYFHDVSDFTLAGTSNISSWALGEAFPLASVTFFDGSHDLVANNSFQDADMGLVFEGGGTARPTSPFSDGSRNIVWGNTFTPDPLSDQYPGLLSPSTALRIGESFDRIYNNAFDNGSGLRSNAVSPARFSNWWNVTCVAGYAPLTAASYPGPVACEPASYAQYANGFELTGSILHTDYQGGNYWSSYGDHANPYGVLPFKEERSSAGPGIGSSAASFAGDYAPLIPTKVYRVTYTELDLPDSARANTFVVKLSSAAGGPVLWRNESATNTILAGCPVASICVTFYVPNGYYEFQVSTFTFHGTAYLPDPASGYFAVSGHMPATTSIVFVREPHGSDPVSATAALILPGASKGR